MKNYYVSIFLLFTLLSCSKKQELKQFSLDQINDLKSYNNLDSLPKDLDEVYRLDLSKKGFKKLPEIVFELSNLQELNVSENSLSDLNGISQLKKLQILNIGMNDFKIFPNEVTTLKNLKVLDVWWNDIKTFPESFYQNNDEIEELNMTSMFEFDFSANLSKIHKFKNLKQLNLGNNQIKNLNIQFEKIINLETFGYIRQDKIDVKNIILALSKCKKLKTIHLSVNHIKELPNEISLLNNLEELNLYENELTNLPDILLEMKKLKSITLDGNKIDKRIISKFEAKMPNTTFIY
ncbi:MULTISPECIES: leucine-rich repeat domain-containing protein [Flavobacterium]|uniref:leucine-rich repeat domain-containing protein n=1 Tax=Flavobacterium TaxID=237 RepID=UPI0011837853|nr:MULTISPECIES: hypothetical protein [Flavobacterium]MCR4032655.1 hypothetical protein [Flavobacterium panacis]